MLHSSGSRCTAGLTQTTQLFQSRQLSWREECSKTSCLCIAAAGLAQPGQGQKRVSTPAQLQQGQSGGCNSCRAQLMMGRPLPLAEVGEPRMPAAYMVQSSHCDKKRRKEVTARHAADHCTARRRHAAVCQQQGGSGSSQVTDDWLWQKDLDCLGRYLHGKRVAWLDRCHNSGR